MANKLYIDGAGKLLLNADGTVIYGDTATVQAAFEECCCPCECPGDTGDFRIAGYVGDMWDEIFANYTPSQWNAGDVYHTGHYLTNPYLPYGAPVVWQGVFTAFDADYCSFTYLSGATPGYVQLAAEDHFLAVGSAYLRLEVLTKRWHLWISFQVAGTGATILAWEGYKAGCSGPAGTYTQTAGESTLAEIEIEGVA